MQWGDNKISFVPVPETKQNFTTAWKGGLYAPCKDEKVGDASHARAKCLSFSESHKLRHLQGLQPWEILRAAALMGRKGWALEVC